MVLQTHPNLQFKDILMKEVHSFRSHVNRLYTQFKQQKNRKENLPDNHVYIHMDFAEDYRCRSQNEIQSAYRDTSCFCCNCFDHNFRKDLVLQRLG